MDGVKKSDSIARVLVDVPLAQPLDYLAPPDAPVGALCVVPLGRRRQIGIVVELGAQSSLDPARLKPIGAVLPAPRLSPAWLALSRFAADYYHYPWGEVALPALPPLLRSVPRPPRPVVKSRKKNLAAGPAPEAGAVESESRAGQDGVAPDTPGAAPSSAAAPVAGPALRAEQQAAVDAIADAQGFAPFLLFGVTGSGKTEVYLGAIERILARAARHGEVAQALVLVPEINLTPQLQARLAERFPGQRVLSLHSGLPPRERADAWLQAHAGTAQIILGTRTAVFASLRCLRLIVVDEEHDGSLKAHGGAPYSARDLAVKRAQIEGIAVVLGSATPALETWHAAQGGRYRLLELAQRAAGNAATPRIETVDLQRHPADQGLAQPLREALEQTLGRGEQALLFINRRGYAPVLRCASCEWHSRCPHCDTFAAFHKVGARLRCHHCGWNQAVPRACPDCGNQDLQGVGQGTQRVEENVRRLWPQARIARIDRDNSQGVRGASRAGAAFEAVHAGEVDILVGTQMITKGHDFRRVSTVGVLNADAQLVAADFRAPERLFAVLMQVAGRAGRAGQASRVLIQTRYPQHPLYAALARQSYAEFAAEQIDERRAAGMPPFAHHALLTAAAHTLEQALDFLRRCAELRQGLEAAAGVTLFDAIPMPLARLAAESRGQLLVEARRRADLHAFLDAWLPRLRALGNRGVLRWAIEVDPQSI